LERLLPRRSAEAENWIQKAKENLNKAIDIIKEGSADGWMEKYEKELALL